MEEAFEQIYQYAEHLSHQNNTSLRKEIELCFEDYRNALSHCLMTKIESRKYYPKMDRQVFLFVGETGQGKSTVINWFLGEEEAKEGDTMDSETVDCGIYNINIQFCDDEKKKLSLVDTPGLWSTDEEEDDEKILNKILESIYELKEDAFIRAIFLVWSPTRSYKFRLAPMLEHLKKTFGAEVLESLIITVNKHTDEWNSKHDKLLEDLHAKAEDAREKYEINLPIMTGNFKDCEFNQENWKTVLKKVTKVTRFNEADFEEYRKQIYLSKFKKVWKNEKSREENERNQKNINELKAKTQAFEEQKRELGRKNEALLEIVRQRDLELKKRDEEERKRKDEEERKRKEEEERKRKEEEERKRRLYPTCFYGYSSSDYFYPATSGVSTICSQSNQSNNVSQSNQSYYADLGLKADINGRYHAPAGGICVNGKDFGGGQYLPKQIVSI